MKEFTSGAKSSEEAPRYDLLEPAFLDATARRMAQGAASHGERNYLKGAGDPAFVRDRLNHLLGHVLKLVAGDDSDDHLAAAAANLNMLAVLLVDHGASQILESGTPTYDEKRTSHLVPCRCGHLFTQPHLCAQSGACMAENHPHFSVTPKPVTVTQNAVTAVLDDLP